MLLAVFVGSAPAAAEAPAPQNRAANVADFVPAGWAIEQLHAADLNRDGREDALLLLRDEAATGPGPGRSPPRMLAVLLGDSAGFVLSARNTKLIPQVDLANQEDPLADGEIVARTGGFDIKLGLLSGVGSYLSMVMRYQFAYQDGCFRLIGYDRLETHRATLDTHDLSINYLTGVVARTSGNARTEANTVVSTTLATPPHRCLEDLDNAADFAPP